jgi:hypothetical protein
MEQTSSQAAEICTRPAPEHSFEFGQTSKVCVTAPPGGMVLKLLRGVLSDVVSDVLAREVVLGE